MIYVVKASGNIEVHGSVQKAFLEAEGDIIVRGGIVGRDEGRWRRRAFHLRQVYAQHPVGGREEYHRNEEILHCRADAGKLVYCNGRRAKIVGGVIRAGDEVNARDIGAESYTARSACGYESEILQHITDSTMCSNQHVMKKTGSARMSPH
jgi:uncharacterized protein (DUF342 family)